MGEEPTGEVLTAGEVAQWLDWRPNSVYIAARAGRLPAGKVGAQWRFSREAIRPYVGARRIWPSRIAEARPPRRARVEGLAPFGVTMDASEAAEWLRVDRTTLYAEVRAGTIPGAKAGGRWRFSREQLLAFLAGEVSLQVET